MIEISRITKDEWKQYKDFWLMALKTEPYAFTMSYEEGAWQRDEYWIQTVSRYASTALDQLFVAKDSETWVGVAGFYIGPFHKKRHIATIYNVYVTSPYRKQGVGKKLIQHIIDTAEKMKSVELIRLHVLSKQQSAIKLYNSCGFEVVAKLIHEVKMGEEYVDEWIMEKKIYSFQIANIKLEI